MSALGLRMTPPAPGKPIIHADRQGKHVVGHPNYQVGKSILTYPDPQELVNRFAGTGQQVGAMVLGSPGSKERVDFGFVIGLWLSPAAGATPAQTTKGIIHYGIGGVHIVPARP